MSDLSNQFERLANRGTRHDGDAVLAAAQRDAAAGADVIPLVNTEPVASRRRRRRTGSIVAAAGVAATMFVGALAVGSYVGSGGGSNSPEGAVRQLADAVSHEDVLAAADVLAPDEVHSLHATLTDAERKAQELKLADDAAAPLTGLDLSVDGLSLSTETLAPGYAKVTVDGGTISARTHKGQFSPLVQKALRDTNDGSAHANLARGPEGGLPTFVMTVQREGHWYVSAAYTALEYIREANHLPGADFGSGQRAIATLGAGAADTAATDALQALARGDWERLISLAPPGELPVYDYRAALLQLAKGDPYTGFAVDHVAADATVDGDTAKVVLDAAGHTDSGTWTIKGGCLGLPVEGADGTTAAPETCSGTAAAALSMIPLGFSGNDSASAITAVREDGRWFVSPVGTVLDWLDQSIRSLTARDIYTLVGLPDLIPPDGSLSLGRPVTFPTAGGTHVFTFSGHRGERLLAQERSSAQPDPAFGSFGFVQVFGPDGRQLADSYGLFNGIDSGGLTLDADGTYTFAVLTTGSATAGDTIFTIWDAADAPDSVKHPINIVEGGAGCVMTSDGGMKCSSDSSSGVTITSVSPGTPLTIPGVPSSSSTTAVAGG